MHKKSGRPGILTKTDHKPKKSTAVKGSASMGGAEKLLSVSKAGRGAAKKTTSSRVKHKKTMY
jgi:hypothetical protein